MKDNENNYGSLKMIALTLGDPYKSISWSGTNNSLVHLFEKKTNLIKVLDADLNGYNKYYSALFNFSFNRKRWGNKLHQNPWAFNARTQAIKKKIDKIIDKYNLIYQEGAMFMPGYKPDIPYVSYHDSNVILSTGGGLYAQGSHYTKSNLIKTIKQEKKVYETASLIFTMSDWLKESIIRDFGINDNKIVTIYAGSNVDVEDYNKIYDGKTILFIGKDFERKGGKVLLEAFKIVRKVIKESKLIIVGPELSVIQDGVELMGHISNKQELAQYFKNASVFVMPSLFEPFGLVFVEAFSYKNPCIGTDICAMPEIIEEGKGGFLVPPNNVKILADRIILLLRDPELSRKMGIYGYTKVNRLYNWNAVVDKMLSHCAKII